MKPFKLRKFPSLYRSEKFERSIGHFMINWGLLEFEIDLTFPILFRTEPTLACCIFANLGIKAKLDIIASAISMLAPLIPSFRVDKAHKLIGQIRQLSGTGRNTLAHGQPWVFTEDDGSQGWTLIRMAAREALDVAEYPITHTHWNTLSKRVETIARQWHNNIEQIQRSLGKVSDSEIEQACGFYVRSAAPVSRRRRKPLAPKIHGSRGGQATPE